MSIEGKARELALKDRNRPPLTRREAVAKISRILDRLADDEERRKVLSIVGDLTGLYAEAK